MCRQSHVASLKLIHANPDEGTTLSVISYFKIFTYNLRAEKNPALLRGFEPRFLGDYIQYMSKHVTTNIKIKESSGWQNKEISAIGLDIVTFRERNGALRQKLPDVTRGFCISYENLQTV